MKQLIGREYEVSRQVARYGSVDSAWRYVYKRYGVARSMFRAFCHRHTINAGRYAR